MTRQVCLSDPSAEMMFMGNYIIFSGQVWFVIVVLLQTRPVSGACSNAFLKVLLWAFCTGSLPFLRFPDWTWFFFDMLYVKGVFMSLLATHSISKGFTYRKWLERRTQYLIHYQNICIVREGWAAIKTDHYSRCVVGKIKERDRKSTRLNSSHL